MSAGLARGCLKAPMEFVTSRESFGKPLTAHQAVAFGVADLSAMTDTARLLTYDAAWKYDTGRPIEREAAVSKLMASELANHVAYKASQLHGGYGFMDDSDVTRHYRHGRPLVGLHPVVPAVLERDAAPAGDPVGHGDVGDVEARPEDDRVDLVLAAVGRHHRPRPHLGQPGSDQADVGLGEGWQVVVGDE